MRAGATAHRTARAVLSPAGIRGTSIEIVWAAAHAALYPMGALRERARTEADRYSLRGLPPVQRGLLLGDVEAAGTPIVLVHGWVDNRSVFTLLRRALQRRGFGRVVSMNYNVLTHDVPRAARRLHALVEQLCEETGYEQVHVVGHSMGGLVARYYVQRLGGDERVHTLATLGTPHHGTRAAHLMLGRAVKDLRVGSAVIRELAEPAVSCRTRFVAFWSDLDELVVPKVSAQIRHPDLSARNVFVRGTGHLSLPIDRRVVHEIATTLAQLESDGSTITRGVTPITATAPPARSPRRGGSTAASEGAG
ncbi:MAG TPA: alpha/beta fold hydrolase [Mycobacteriales bacterium]|nr:alpha/beta fold hydrolase [Mycobacteriales bacterium]